MKKALLAVIFMAGTASSFVIGYTYRVNSEQVTQAEVIQKHPFSEDVLWKIVGEWRIQNNMPTYIKDQKLCDIAALRLEQIQKDWSHDGFKSMGDFRYKYTNAKEIGENLGKEFNTEQDNLNSWLASPTHLENLKKTYTHSCIKANEKGFSVQLFASY